MPTRRTFLRHATAAAAVATASPLSATSSPAEELTLIDTHQHLWDLSRFRLPWLKDAPQILNRSYLTEDYLQAAAGLSIQQCIYLEVDLDKQQQVAEARFVEEISQSDRHPTVAGVISGQCDQPSFATYIRQFKDSGAIKGVRHILEAAPQGTCLKPQFIQSVQLLGKLQKSFDLTIRPTELADGLELVKRCPDTLFVIDHCGVADPKAFMKAHRDQAMHRADPWKRDMEKLAMQPNTVCKISGIIAHVPKQWSTADLAPIVHHCLETFGPDRVLFGGDWPVCLLGGTLRKWVQSLQEIVQDRPLSEQRKLFSHNAIRHYRLAPRG